MIKSIYLNDGQPVEINTAAGWVIRYRETFGHDILPDILPILEAVTLAAIELIDETEDGSITAASVVNSLKDGSLIPALSVLAGLEVTTVLQIIWSMAKEADETGAVPGFNAWIRTIEKCPMDEIAPQLFWDISDGFVSKKKMDKLKAGMLKAGMKKPEPKETPATS